MAEVADSGDVMLEASTSAANEFMNSEIFQRGMGDYQYAPVLATPWSHIFWKAKAAITLDPCKEP